MENDYKDKKILIIGLGFSGGGIGVVRFLSKQGAHISVADQKSKKALKDSIEKIRKYKNIKFILGKQSNVQSRMLNKFDIAVLNPAVDLRSSFVKKVRKARIPIESELGLFLKHCTGKVIAITGTKGKGTTATLVYTILKKAKKDVLLGGNIGISLLGKLPRISKNTFVVLEVSSFQLDLLALAKAKPHFFISALTNIYHDHLDRYNSFDEYKKSKLSIFKHKAKYKTNGLSFFAKATKDKKPTLLPFWIDDKKIKLIGEHNKKNIAFAVEIVKHLTIKKEIIAKAIYGFRGLPHRLKYIGIKNGVTFYNDSYSTTLDSTIFALRSLAEPVRILRRRRGEGGAAQKIILIMGGVNKGLSFNTLAKVAKKYAKAVILFGKSAKEIRRSFMNVKSSTLDTWVVGTLREAVDKAKKIAVKGDIILFSPACASFDQFRNAKERGELFKKLVQNL